MSALSFYRWRKVAKAQRKSGVPRRGRPTAERSMGLDTALRSELKKRIQRALPDILQQEVRSAVDRALGPQRG